MKNKVVLLTGANSGIGKATALYFAKEGCKVIVNYVTNSKEAQNVVKKINSLGSKAIAIKADITKEKEVQELFKKGLKECQKEKKESS